MNKLFTKIVGAALGATMAIGVGVAVASNSRDVKQAEAAAGSTLVFEITQSSVTSYPSSYSDTETTWTQKDTTGKVDMSFALAQHMKNSSNMQSSASKGYFRNTTIPSGYAIKSVGVTTGSGSNRSWTMYGDDTVLTKSNYGTSGSNLGSYTSSSTAKAFGSGTTYSSTEYPYSYFFAIRGSNAQYSSKYTITLVELAAKSLSSISLDTTNVTKTFTTGDTFSSTGLVTTAHYSDETSKTVTPTSISTPDMSTSGQKTVTVSYTEGGVTKTATYYIQVNDPRTVASLTVYDSNMDELEDGGEVSLTASSGTSISTNVMCEITYSPSGSDGNTVITSATGVGFSVTTTDHETYTLTFTANGDHAITFAAFEDESVSLTVTYHVDGLPNITYVTDTIDNALTGVGDVTNYTDWSGKSDQSDAVYAGQTAGQHTTVQMRSNNNNSGVITTTTAGGVVTSIKVTFNSNSADTRRVDFYGKNTSYSSPTDLYNDSLQGTVIGSATYDGSELEYTIDVSDDTTKQFAYIGFRSNSGALYLDSVEITWAIEQEIVDTLESIEIDGSLETTSYYEGQTISLSGLTVYGNYTHAGKVSLMGKTGLVFASTPATATSTSLDEITVNASFENKNASETYTISVSPDEVTALSWGTRGYENGDYFLDGKKLSEIIDTSKWTFSATWASGIAKPNPSFGTGADDVHVGLYDNPTPTSETATALTNNYTFTTSDDGMYLVAFYKGTHSGSNRRLFITESLNSIVKPAEGEPGYFLVKDSSNLKAGDTVVIAAFNYNYAMSSTQSSNNRAGVEITKDSSDSSMTIASGVQTFTLEAGTVSGTWSFNTGDGYIYAASNSANHLKTEETKTGNSSFTLSISNSGSAGLVANGNYSHKTMSWNNGSTLFSCYSSLQSNGQLAIYKYTEPMDEPINNLNLKAQHAAVAFANKLLEETGKVCLSDGIKGVAELQAAWKNSYDEFVALRNSLVINPGQADEDTSDRDFFDNLIIYAVRTPAKQDNTGDTLQNALARYDRIYTRYTSSLSTQGDFLKTISGRGASQPLESSNPINFGVIGANSNVVVVIIVTSMISLVAIGGYFFIRRRKKHN